MVTFILNLANSSKISPSKLIFIPIFVGVICITTSASFRAFLAHSTPSLSITLTDDIALHLLYLPVLYCT
jgi:glutamate/tyrosine decarboxylase-like PLP-dependent enzyme